MAQMRNTGIISSPFIPAGNSVARVMLTVILALVPGIAAYAYMYGWGVVLNIVIAGASGWVFELAMLLLLSRPLKPFILDFSALLTAILFALALPPLVSWWVPVVGMFFAIVVAKHLYGGLGYNAFNPAMAAYAVILVSFPREMSIWISPYEIAPVHLGFLETANYVFIHRLPELLNIDVLSTATPLDYLRTEVRLHHGIHDTSHAAVFGMLGGKGMEWVNLCFLAGGLFLYYRKIISWHIPVALLLTLFVISSFFHLLSPDRYAGSLIHIFGGAGILGAFFIATDPVTAATTPLGKIIYGAGIGIITYAIRAWGGYPDGVAFAVILMGLTVPLLDQYTQPRVYGQSRRNET